MNTTTAALILILHVFIGVQEQVPSAPADPEPGGHNQARANSYDDAWQDKWVSNVRAIIRGGTGKTPGFAIYLGDSLTRGAAFAGWARGGDGKTAEDVAITEWLHASEDPITIDSKDGFGLATPYICAHRSYTVGDGLGAWHLIGKQGPVEPDPVLAREVILDCATYPNALRLVTILAAFPDVQFAALEYNLRASDPSDVADLEAMVDMLIDAHVVPILWTYTYRSSARFNAFVDEYNLALYDLARRRGLPLIDLQAEMLARRPFEEWIGTYLRFDGVHYTDGVNGFTPTSDPYLPGGDPETHTTGDALLNNGSGLKGWLTVVKMKEIRAAING